MKIAQTPLPETIQKLLAANDPNPVVMVNLLKFKRDATEPHHGLTGQAAYAKYGVAMRGIVEAGGGRFIWSGAVRQMVLGESDVDFDMVALVEYPSAAAFVKIVSDPRVAEIGVHRVAGLEGQWLIATTASSLG